MAVHPPPFDWGLEQPPADVRVPDPERSALRAADLPEVRELVARGWHLTPDAPAWAFLPAIWPVDHRTWVPDRSTSYQAHWRTTPSGAVQQDTPIPWTAVDYDQIYGEIVDLLAEAGVPAPPRGRLWLVKLPDEFSTIEQLTTRLVTVAEAAGVPPACSSEFIALVRQELSRWW